MRKFTTILFITLVSVLFVAFPAYAVVTAPRVSVSYSNETANSVNVTLQWDDFGNGTHYDAYWADGMLSDSSGLDLHNISGSLVTASGKVSLTKTGLQKYRNYFFKIVNNDNVNSAPTTVRVYPGTTGGTRPTNESAHGNYTENTAMCGWCHNTHSSLKEQLLKESTYYQLCKLCHGTASTQSKYDVESGKVSVSDGGTGISTVDSLGGPFVSGVTSKHNADDSDLGWGPVIVPGSDPTKRLSLSCLSCHNSHGGTDDNYRLLRKTLYVDDLKSSDLKSVNVDFDAFAITSSNTSGESLYMVKGNTEFCSACHLDYDNGNSQVAGSDPRLTTSQAVYRHPTTVEGAVYYSVFGSDGNQDFSPSPWGPLPLQYFSGEANSSITDLRTTVVCSTCHFAHGTTKTFSAVTGTDKYILRLDNYGVCESCHKK